MTEPPAPPTIPRRTLVLGGLLGGLALAAGYLALATPWFREGTLEPDEPSPCLVCGQQVVMRPHKGRPHARCPSCGSLERHRLLVHYLEHAPGLLAPGQRVLHFAPNSGVEAFMRRRAGLRYLTADLYATADLRLDLTAIAQPDASWDLVICYHVLEHVPDDATAMRELRRILAPGGRAILQVPLELGRDVTDEDPSLGPQQRLERFGQEDHVRIYGIADFGRRLRAAGFTVDAVDYAGSLPPQEVALHHLVQQPGEGPVLDERIWVAIRPG